MFHFCIYMKSTGKIWPCSDTLQLALFRMHPCSFLSYGTKVIEVSSVVKVCNSMPPAPGRTIDLTTKACVVQAMPGCMLTYLLTAIGARPRHPCERELSHGALARSSAHSCRKTASCLSFDLHHARIACSVCCNCAWGYNRPADISK